MNWSSNPFQDRIWDWVHPSHRDLIIDQLSANEQMALRYLEHGGHSAIALALSVEGGAAGLRRFPLMGHPGSWPVLTKACLRLLKKDSISSASRVLSIIEGASTGNIRPELKQLIIEICNATRLHWDDGKAELSPQLIKKFNKIADRSGQYLSMPALHSSWNSSCEDMREGARRAHEESDFDGESLRTWAEMAEVVSNVEPRLLPRDIESEFLGVLQEWLDAIDKTAQMEIDEEEDEDTFFSESRRFERLASAVESVSHLFPSLSSSLSSLEEVLTSKANDWGEEARKRSYEPGDSDSEYEPGGVSPELSPEQIFEDL